MKRLKQILLGLLVLFSIMWFYSHAEMHPRNEIKDPSKMGFTPDQMEWVETTLAEGHDPFTYSR